MSNAPERVYWHLSDRRLSMVKPVGMDVIEYVPAHIAAERIETLEAQLADCGKVITDLRTHQRDLHAHANALWQCVLKHEGAE